jgi:hypothetical protein
MVQKDHEIKGVYLRNTGDLHIWGARVINKPKK